MTDTAANSLPVTTATDEQIIAAVRTGTHVLIPRGSDWAVGALDVEPERWAGQSGLIVVLTPEQCRAVAAAMTSPDATDVPEDDGLARVPLGPVLDLWEELVRAGGMPPLSPAHGRAIAAALWRLRRSQALGEDEDNGHH